MKTLKIALFFFFFGVSVLPHGAAEEEKKSLSSIQTHTVTPTSQKTYKLNNSGFNKNSSVLEYAHQPGHEVFEDNDLDGRYGEREARGIDRDRDGRKGEQEAQLGIESVSQNQKITVLNNMGSGRALSSFQAAGQTQRSSIFKEESVSEEEPSEEISETASQPAPAPSPETKARRVLVS